MKTITFNGAEYQAPDWANWVAQDSSGTIMAYERRPIQFDNCCWDIEQDGDRFTVIWSGWKRDAVANWADTLTSIGG